MIQAQDVNKNYIINLRHIFIPEKDHMLIDFEGEQRGKEALGNIRGGEEKIINYVK